MKIIKYISFFIYSLILLSANAQQDTVRYVGSTLSNVDYHHGELTPVVGVHNIQVFRANREHPEWTGGMNWTYNHQPMLVFWNNQFYLHFLSDPVGEHIPPGATYIISSKDGYSWTDPKTLFPEYNVPDGYSKKDIPERAKNLKAVMHQRVGFYVSKKGKLLAQGFYGVALNAKDDPNDGNGIGRVVREINKNGSFGPIYFLRYNHGFNEKNTDFPFYKASKDKNFITACEEILSNPLQTQQWVEEADRDDPLITIKKQFKAFNYYHLLNGNVVGLWKYALTSISKDQGHSWEYNPTRAPGFVNANAKIWGQRTLSGKYITVCNPSEYRWPLALSTSKDGLVYDDLLLVNGEITSMRYGGNYKSYGPQYVRGIQEGNGIPPDQKSWVVYSVNKEDIWAASIPKIISDSVTENVNDVFSEMKDNVELSQWNIYSPLWAKAQIEKVNGKKVLALHDYDPFDFAKVDRVVPESNHVKLDFTITPQQSDFGLLEIEIQNAQNLPAVRISFDSTGEIITKAGYRNKGLGKYEKGKPYRFEIDLNTKTRFYTVSINGAKPSNNLLFAPIAKVHHVTFRTGAARHFPDADTPTDQSYDLPNAGEKTKEAIYYIDYFKSEKL
ncbi:MAG: six-hairpin glycosidase [Pseudopedobacter saltans]|uniref:Six-hairpin glycosidase n=1 Tax=Pseudopedobacter saltans TaxID=151895 RepID=A0A2W5ET45_9SPHI|nr:MAG: six-hairpin glycosidase [Pseudopedobacter saltans]